MPGGVAYPKADQTGNSPGKNRWCPKTGALHADCDCPVSRGKRNKANGRGGQRQGIKTAVKVLGGEPAKYASQMGNEENLRLAARLEVKQGDQCGPAVNFYLRTRAQADLPRNKAVGDTRPFVAVAIAGGVELWVVRPDDLEQLFAEARRGTL